MGVRGRAPGVVLDAMALTQELLAYVDESGNTGDVTLPADGAPPHADQPVFVLAAVLVPKACLPAFEAEVQALKARHGILDQELKASTLLTTHPEFVAAVSGVLEQGQYPVLAEVVDKKYMLCAQLTNLVFRAAMSEVSHEALQEFADLLWTAAPAVLLTQFSAVCRAPEPSAFDELVDNLKRWLKTEDAVPLMVFATAALDLSLRGFSMERLLPEPDFAGRRRTRVSTLPQMSSLANIGFRVEQYRRDADFSAVRLVHDEQQEWWPILSQNMEWARTHDMSQWVSGDEFAGRLVFDLSHTTFETANSADTLGIQVADLMAGTAFRAWKAFQAKRPLDVSMGSVLRRLLDGCRATECAGINFVVSTHELRRFLRYAGWSVG